MMTLQVPSPVESHFESWRSVPPETDDSRGKSFRWKRSRRTDCYGKLNAGGWGGEEAGRRATYLARRKQDLVRYRSPVRVGLMSSNAIARSIRVGSTASY